MGGDVATNRLHDTDDFMARHDRDRAIRQLAVDDVKIRATDTARQNPDHHVRWSWGRLRNFDGIEVPEPFLLRTIALTS